MKATYNRAVLSARGIIQQTAKINGVSYEEVYEGFQNTIANGLASTNPTSIEFWRNVTRQAGKEVPTPEDLLIHITAMSPQMKEAGFQKLGFTGSLFH